MALVPNFHIFVKFGLVIVDGAPEILLRGEYIFTIKK